MMFNKVILVGNLTRDIEIRYTQSGRAIANAGIATNRKWKDQGGQQKEEVMFIDITLFGRTAEIANQYLRKGSKVLVEGRLVLEQWTAQDGSKRSKHSITVQEMKMLDGRHEGAVHEEEPQPEAAPASGATTPPQNKYTPPPAPTVPDIDIDEEEIPL